MQSKCKAMQSNFTRLVFVFILYNYLIINEAVVLFRYAVFTFCNYGFVLIYLPTICFTTSVNLRLLVANLHKYFYNCKYFLFFLRNSFYGEFSVDLTTQM